MNGRYSAIGSRLRGERKAAAAGSNKLDGEHTAGEHTVGEHRNVS